MQRLSFFILFAALVALSPAADAGTIAVHGSTTVAGAVMMPHKAEIEQASDTTLDIVGNGSGRGLADLTTGKADIAMISAPLEAEVAASNAKTPGNLDASKLIAHQIGAANVAFVVHASNPVTTLTLAQIADILSGKVTKWSEVGGADQPIVVVVATRGDGVRSVVESRLLNGASVVAGGKELPNASQIGQVAAQLPTAFGVMSAGAVRPGVIVIKTDKTVDQPLILVTLGPPSPDAAKIIEAAKAAGAH